MLVGWVSEIILWGTIVLLTYTLGDRFVDWLELPFSTASQTITLHFNDVSQLAVGSPVRWMGVDVGYVSHVQPQNGHVKVVAQIKPGTVMIPRGSHFTVEFNGLAGSKSLEIIPPRKDYGLHGEVIEGYDIEEPIRLQDVLDTQMIVADAMEHSMDNIKDSLEELQREYQIEEELREVLLKLETMNGNLAQMESRLLATHQQMNTQTRDILQSLSEAMAPLQGVKPWVNGANNAIEILASTEQLFSNFEVAMINLPKSEQVLALRQFSERLRVFSKGLDEPAQKSLLDELQQCLNKAELISRTSQSLMDASPENEPLTAKECIDKLKVETQQWTLWSQNLLKF